MMTITMLPVLHSVMRTVRSTTTTIWKCTSSLHTSGCSTATVRDVRMEKEKLTPPVKTEVKLAMCPITESEDHKTIKKELDKYSLTDIMVGHILSLDILVPKVALESNITVFREKLISISRKELPGNLSPEIKVGRFTVANNEIIKLNWNKLITALKLKEDKVIQELFENTRKNKVTGIKKNIVGYFLSQGLSDVRLATEVFQRARILLCEKKGHYTPEEDQIIIDFVEKEGKKWAKLSTLMGRNTRTLRTRYEGLQSQDDVQCGRYTADEDQLILRDVFAVNKNILDDGKITKEDYQRIGNKLRRTPRSIREHWRNQLEPMFKMYNAKTLHMDMKEVLINHLVEHNLNYAQEVDWKELVQMPKFAGTTPAYLQQMLAGLQIAAGKKYPELSQVELTTGNIQRYLDNSDRKMNKRKTEYERELIEFYGSQILNKL